MRKESIFEAMENDIMNAGLNERERGILLRNVMRLKEEKVNIMVTGATGSGKSSTINALFDTEVAKVGVGVDPETMDITKYELDNLVLWDTPGLGDGRESDIRHAKNIINKLTEVDANGKALIDLVLVIVDGGSRDLGTSFELINKVIIPNLGPNMEDRILVAINQADVAMKGRNWDAEKNEPNEQLKAFLEEKVASVRARILEGTGVEVTPIYYSAGYKEDGKAQTKPYNLSKLLYYIVKSTPLEKRLAYADNINPDASVWEDDDELIDYSEETRKSMIETIVETAREFGDIGADIGKIIFGPAGEKVGRAVATVAGAVYGFFSSLF